MFIYYLRLQINKKKSKPRNLDKKKSNSFEFNFIQVNWL